MLDFNEVKINISALKPQIDDLKDAIGTEKLENTLDELNLKASEPNFWNDMELSKSVNQKITKIKNKLQSYHKLVSSFEDAEAMASIAMEENDQDALAEAFEEYKRTVKLLETERLSTLLTGEYDSKNAILTFHAGAGGTEAQDWVEMLLRMYTMWADKNGYKHKILDYLDGEEAGIKSVTILMEGENAYGFLRSETGVHRLIRISPFDTSGKRHTSFASLEVMPQIDDEINIEINECDLKTDTYRASGAGGQHVNKTESAVRITHIPTGVVVACQNERSQHMNREVAMNMLKSKLFEIKEREHLDKIEDIKGDQKDIGWGNQIRTYTFMPYTLVKDHRSGFETGNISAVMDGEIDEFINAFLKMPM